MRPLIRKSVIKENKENFNSATMLNLDELRAEIYKLLASLLEEEVADALTDAIVDIIEGAEKENEEARMPISK